MTSTDTLLPCPFCGGEARISRAHQNKMLAMGEVPTDEHYLFTLYHDCANGITICWTYKPKDALIAAWNRRTPPTPATDEREAVAVAALINALKQAGGYPATISHLKSGKFSDSISVRIAIAAIMDASAAEILAAEANERARALGQSDWLDIETAPRDGRVVLCIGHNNIHHVEPMMYYAADDGMDNGCWGWLEGDTPRKQPTHWMPLPAPPNL